MPRVLKDADHLATIAAGKKMIGFALGFCLLGLAIHWARGGAAGSGLLQGWFVFGIFAVAVPFGFGGTALLIAGLTRYNGQLSKGQLASDLLQADALKRGPSERGTSRRGPSERDTSQRDTTPP